MVLVTIDSAYLLSNIFSLPSVSRQYTELESINYPRSVRARGYFELSCGAAELRSPSPPNYSSNKPEKWPALPLAWPRHQEIETSKI